MSARLHRPCQVRFDEICGVLCGQQRRRRDVPVGSPTGRVQTPTGRPARDRAAAAPWSPRAPGRIGIFWPPPGSLRPIRASDYRGTASLRIRPWWPYAALSREMPRHVAAGARL